MPSTWTLCLLSSSRPFVPRTLAVRDRTTRAAAVLLAPGVWQGRALAPLDHVDDVEQKPAGRLVGLDQLDPELVAQPVGLAGALADQELAALVVTEELLAEAADRDQPVRSRTVEGGEQAEAG